MTIYGKKQTGMPQGTDEPKRSCNFEVMHSLLLSLIWFPEVSSKTSCISHCWRQAIRPDEVLILSSVSNAIYKAKKHNEL